MNKLSKKDLFIYRLFLKNMNNVIIDNELDNYLLSIMNFIENNYISDNNNNYDLNDFIQECFLAFYELKKDNKLSHIKYNDELIAIYLNMNTTQKSLKKELA